MTISVFDAYAKAYDVALFGRGKNERARHEAPHSSETPIKRSGLRRASSAALCGFIRSRQR